MSAPPRWDNLIKTAYMEKNHPTLVKTYLRRGVISPRWDEFIII